MALAFISTWQCIQKLQNYADLEVRSWNPFKLFRKRRLTNHAIAGDLAKILGQERLSDSELLQIAKAIDGFDDSKLQYDLVCFLYCQINESSNPFAAKRKNIIEINQVLEHLINKKYRPWWTFYLIELPYFSDRVRSTLNWLISAFCDLFASRREERRQHLINLYANDELAQQIISQYSRNPKTEKKEKLNKLLDTSIEQAADHTQRELLKEIRKIILKELPFGEVLISTAGLSYIMGSYLAKKGNKTKSVHAQAQEILYIISKVYLKVSAAQIAKAVVPGVSEVVEALVSVTVSESTKNPLDTDKKIARAFASIAGGTVGGALGSVVPGLGTTAGVYAGAILGKVAVTQFYQVLEQWQTTPERAESIPPYLTSFFALIDNDKARILEPIYRRYLHTENESKRLGDAIAKWLSIYDTLLDNSGGCIAEEYLDIIDEEMNKLHERFMRLKNEHGGAISDLYAKKPENVPRVEEYKAKVKTYLVPLQAPIDGMIKKYLGSRPSAGPSTDSYAGPLKELHTMPDDIILSPTGKTPDLNINSRGLFAEQFVTEEREPSLGFEQRFGG